MSPEADALLIVSPNWLGDCIMALPALQVLREQNKSLQLILLCKPQMRPLWELHRAPDKIITLNAGASGILAAARNVKSLRPQRAVLLNRTFRAAFAAFLAGIPERRGRAGNFRRFLLSDVARFSPELHSAHQQYEYLELLMPGSNAALPPPQLDLPEPELQPVELPLVGMIPGAARGPSKQWPAEHFIALGKRIAESNRARVLLFGTPAERALCEEIAAGVGPAENLAGKLGFREWLTSLKRCAVVVANDSGGMHAAAACGTAVVAIFGISDPQKTGPLGTHVRILQKSEKRARAVPRNSAEAKAALRAVSPEEVYGAVNDFIANRR